MMQDKRTPPSPSKVEDLVDDEMIVEDDIEEVIDLNDPIFESSSSSDENENPRTEDLMQEDTVDDAIRVFCGHKSHHTVFCCSLSKNGDLAATGGEDDKGYLWNASTGESILNTDDSHNDSVIFSDFNYNDKYVATADMRGKIKLWRISDKTCVWETALMNDINWIKWHPFSDILVTGVETGEVYMLKTRKDDYKIFAQGSGIKSETGIILPDGKRAVIGYENGMIHVIDLKSNTLVSTTPPDQRRLHGHSSSIIALDCYMDNNLLISVSVESQTILSTIHNGKVICVLQDLRRRGNNNDHIEIAAFCKDPTFPVAASATVTSETYGKIYIWDISKQSLRNEMDQEGGITKLVWTKASIFFTAGLDGKLRCFDAKIGHCLRIFSGHKGALYDLCISSDEKKAITVSDDGTARLFDISSIC
ncbi:PREDICTED: angio-associated migratory cell protein [Trachymyrmex septentrionalis]|uniref:angio-associated migratory cell protein n=1 Tax=Trachymyrmex septentrionalis TaxID=34720 RepID=UPI00084F5485|nr:PREDICTED: angio-associated migratory cell protein [Trachymyrmex septentrionalis]